MTRLTRTYLTALASILYLFNGAAAPVIAQQLSFDTLSRKAEDNSHDLLIGRIDTSVARNKIREAKCAYFPTINANLNAEYVGGFGNANTPQNASPVVVGSVILPGNTRFQNAASLNLSYTLFDFGNRASQVAAAKNHTEGLSLQQKASLRELKLAVLEAYQESLLAQKEIRSKKDKLKLQEQLYELNLRLWNAGKISRIELGEQAIAKSDTEREIQELTRHFGELLNKLSSLTHEHYNVDSVDIADFEFEPGNTGAPLFPNPATAEFRSYEKLVQEKKAEIRALKAQRYPQFSVFGSFVMYGANKNSWFGSLNDLGARQFYGGISTTLPVFDAFKTRVAIDGKKLEIQRLIAERDKKMWELRKDYDRAATSATLCKVEMKTSAQLLTHSHEQYSMIVRLTENQMAEKTKALSQQIGLLSHQLQAEKTNIMRLAAAKRLRIYLEV